MSQVDERVAKISFDNDAFEKRAATSLNTINRINEAMQFKGQKDSFSNLTKLANSLNDATYGIQDSVASLSYRFSTLGVMGMQAIQNITNGLMNLGYTLVNKVYDPIVNGGMNRAKNLEQARFMLNGLIDDAEGGAKRVEKILSGPVNNAVSGTRFGLDEAAVAASNLYASGVTDDNDLTKSLQAISGAASMTNREYSDMAQIFSTVKSNGQLMTMQLRQFATYGLNVSAELAKKMGKTEKEINDMVSKGKISYEDFVDVMYKYWDQASKANDTFAGSASNVRAALARIGAEFQSKNLVQMRKWFNSLIPVINYIKSTINPLVELYNKYLAKKRTGIMSIFVAGNEKKGFVVLQRFKDFVEALMGTVSSFGNVVSHTIETVGAFIDRILPKGVLESATSALLNIKGILDGLTDPSNTIMAKVFGKDPSYIEKTSKSFLENIKSVKKEHNDAMHQMVGATKLLDETTKDLTTAEDKLKRLEEKNAKKPSEHLEKRIAEEKGYITKLKDMQNILKQYEASEESKYHNIGEELSVLNYNFRSFNRNSIDEFLMSIAGALASIGTIASNILKPITNRSAYLVNILKSIAGWISDLQFNIEQLFLELSQDNDYLEDVRRIGRGIYSIIHIGLQLINSIIKAVSGVPGKLKSPIKSFTSFIASIADWIYEADKFIEKNDIFTKAINKIVEFITPAINIFKAVIERVKAFFGLFDGEALSFGNIVTFIADSFNHLAEVINQGKDFVGGIGDIFKVVVDKLKGFSPVLKAVITVFESIFGVIKKIFENTKNEMSGWTFFDLLNSILGLINAEAITTAIMLFKTMVKNFTGGSDTLRLLFKNVSDSFVALGNTLEVWQRSIKADVILKIAFAIGVLSLSIISLANTENIDQALNALIVIGAVLGSIFALYEQMNRAPAVTPGGIGGFIQYIQRSFNTIITSGRKSSDALVFIEIAAAVLILAEAVNVLAKAAENPGQMWQGVAAVAALAAALLVVQNYISKSEGGKVRAGTFIALSIAIRIIAGVIKDLSEVIAADPWNALNALLVMELIFAEIASLFWAMSKLDIKGTQAKKLASSMVVMGVALKVMASVINDLSVTIAGDPWNALNAVLIIELIYAEIASLFWAMSKSEIKGNQAKRLASSMVVIGIALEIMVNVIQKLAFLTHVAPWDTLNALLVMELIFAEIASLFLAVKLIKIDNSKMTAVAASLVIFGVGMEIMADVISKLSGLWSTDWTGVIASLLAIASVLVIFGSFSNLTIGADLVVTGQALLIFSAALLVMAGALQTVGSMEPGQIVMSLLAMASLIAIFGALSAAITALSAVIVPGVTALLGIATALSLFAVAIALTTSAMTKFSNMSSKDIEQFFENFKASMQGWAAMLPEILTFVGTFLTNLLRVIGENAIAIGQVVVKLIISVLTVIRDNIGEITSLVLEIITAFVRAIGDNIDDIVAAGLYVIEQFLEGIAQGVPGLITSAVDVIVAFIDGITANLTRIIDAGTNLIVALMFGIATQQATIITTAQELMGWFLDEIGLADVFTAGINVVQGFIDGVKSMWDGVVGAAHTVADWFLNALTDKDGLDEHSPSEKTKKAGEYGVLGFYEGVKNLLNKPAEAGKAMVDEYLKPVSDGAEKSVKEADKAAKGVSNAADKSSSAAKTATKAVEKYIVKYDILTDKAKQLGQALVNGGLSAKGDAGKAGKQLGEAFYGAFKTVSGNTKEYRSYIKGLKGDIKKFISGSELSKYSKLANKLYLKSDAFKQSLNELKGYYREYRKQLKQLEEDSKKKDNGSTIENDKKQLDEIAKKIKQIGKAISKGPEKSLKALRREIKESAKAFLSISNISLDNVLDFQNKVKIASRTSALIGSLSGTLRTTADATKATADQFDLLNVSTETGINLLERFSKVSSVTVRRLMTNAKSQVKAYEEFQNGIAKLRQMGLNADFVDELEAKGPEALGYIRGFIKMTDEEIAEYNGLVEKKQKAESEQLEKNMEDTVNKYAQYYEDIEELAARGLSEGIIKRLKEGGIEQATFVKALLNAPDSTLDNIEDYYQKSVEAIDEISAVRDAENKTYASFAELLEAQVFQKNIWNLMLLKLKQNGIDSELIQTFKEMGYESGHEYVEQILKEIETPGAAERINQSLQNLKDNTDDPAMVWLKNMKVSRRTYTHYENNLKKMAEMLPEGENDPLYQHVKSMGLEDGAEYAEAFVTTSEETRERIIREFNKGQKINSEQLTDQLHQRILEIKQWRDDLTKLANEKYKGSGKKGQNIITDQLMSELVAMGPEAADQIHALANMSHKELAEFASEWDDALKLPTSVSKSVTDAYALTAGDAVKAVKDKLGGEDTKNNLTKAAKTTIVEAAKSVKTTAKAKGEKVGEAAKDGVKKYVNVNKGKQLAGNLCDGLIQGMQDGTGAVVKAAKTLGKKTIKGLKESMVINSPSALTTEMGMFLDLGLAKGIDENLKPVLTSANGVADSIYGSFLSLNDRIQNGVFQPVDYGVNLTPTNTVLDLSTNLAQAKDIMDIFSSISGVNFEISRDANRDVVNAINDMRSDFQSQFDGLSQTISEMQLVMDSGALVGQIANPMNEVLGQRIALAQRGVTA